MIVEPGTEITNLRILSVAHQTRVKETRSWNAECMHCKAVIVISYSGIKTRRVNKTVHCRKCNPNGAGVLASYCVGMKLAQVMLLRERPRRSKSNKLDGGKRTWDVKCIKCGHECARSSNRIRYYDERGESCCPRCNAPEVDQAPLDTKSSVPVIRKSQQRLSGRRGSYEVPLASLWPVFEVARI